MKTYTIEVTRIVHDLLAGSVDVQAETRAEAIEKARDLHQAHKIELSDAGQVDSELAQFEIIPPRRTRHLGGCGMTRRERHLRIIHSFGDHDFLYMLRRFLRRHEKDLACFTDEAVRALATDFVRERSFRQRIDAYNRKIREGRAT